MVNSGWYFLWCVHQFEQIDSGQFAVRIRPSMRFAAYGLIIFGMAIASGLVGRVLTFDALAAQVTRWCFGSAFAGLGIAFLCLPHYKFDTRNDTLTVLRWYRQVATFPISSIIAVRITHSPFRRSGQGRISRRAADAVGLLLSQGTDTQQVRLTFHSDKRATRRMATQLSEALKVPIEGPLPDVESSTESGKGFRARKVVARICYWGACASAVWFLALTVEQASHDMYDRTLREIDAELIERSVVERNIGAGDWFIQGVFDFTLEGRTVRGEGNLISEQFYRENLGNRRDRKIPRQMVESMVGSWEPGQRYQAFVYIDYPTNVFFDRPPSGKVTRTRRWQSVALAGALFLLGLFVSPASVKPPAEDS